jgi:ribosome biogenesis GTPase / thiamine phosphate phosphatase
MVSNKNNTSIGVIIKAHGQQFLVKIDGCDFLATSKGKKRDLVVGDIVEADIINDKQALIVKALERVSLIYRSDNNRSKLIASNITQMLIIIAVQPKFNINFLNSCLICAESQRIQPIIIINKIDLAGSEELSSLISNYYQNKLGYQVLSISALHDCSKLNKLLANNATLLIGQSGVGKSTITNMLIPKANTKTGDLTEDNSKGKHTTTNASLYYIGDDNNTSIIDCPGLQDFGLMHIKPAELAEFFPELRMFIGKCKFRNCMHINEPGCAIQTAIENQKIEPSRANFFISLLNKLTDYGKSHQFKK